jgi:nucleoid DNA-binding protein
MAVRKIAMVVNLRQNKNEAAEHFGKWYPEVDTKTPLDLKGFCAHMTEHGKLADYQMVVLVVQQVVECMKELVLQGQPVKLEGLGTFGPSLESKKGGAASVQAAMDAGLDSLIEGVHMNFTPENTKGEKLTSRALKDECVFDAGYVVESVKQTVDGKVKRYQNKTPIAFILSPANGSGSNTNATPHSQGENPTNPTNGGDGGNSGGGSNSGSQSGTLAAPTISGNTTFTESAQVTISGPDGAEIHYTTDGTVPTAESALYSEAFTLSATTTVKAIAIKDGQSSEVVSRVFTKSSNDDGMGQD